MITLDIKKFFFDRAAVIKAMDAASRRALNKAGGLVRKIARYSIKSRAKGTAPPGQPPYSHVGAKRRKLNRKRKKQGQEPIRGGFQGVKHILYGYEPSRQTVIVGPISNRRGTVTRALEFGGRSGRATIRPHPFMRPALKKAAPEIPMLWANSVRT